MKKNLNNTRRSFLKHVLTGTTAVIGTAAIVKPVNAKSVKTVKTSSHPDETLYHESEDFKKFYKTLRS